MSSLAGAQRVRPLPFDYHRCQADAPDSHCTNCARWVKQPWQTYGERTPMVLRENSQSDGCDYIQASEDQN